MSTVPINPIFGSMLLVSKLAHNFTRTSICFWYYLGPRRSQSWMFIDLLYRKKNENQLKIYFELAPSILLWEYHMCIVDKVFSNLSYCDNFFLQIISRDSVLNNVELYLTANLKSYNPECCQSYFTCSNITLLVRSILSLSLCQILDGFSNFIYSFFLYVFSISLFLGYSLISWYHNSYFW